MKNLKASSLGSLIKSKIVQASNMKYRTKKSLVLCIYTPSRSMPAGERNMMASQGVSLQTPNLTFLPFQTPQHSITKFRESTLGSPYSLYSSTEQFPRLLVKIVHILLCYRYWVVGTR